MKNILKADYNRLLLNKKIIVLDILDEYRYMDEELVGLLRESVAGYLE